MKNESIVFKGINRHSSDIATENGYCEELINVRSENGEMRIVPPKTSLSSTLYDDIFEHVTSSCINYIGHATNAAGYHIFEKFSLTASETATVITNNLIPATDEIYYTCVNNFLVISDKTAVKTYIFIYDGRGTSGYSQFFSGLDALSISKSYSISYNQYSTSTEYLVSQIVPESSIVEEHDESASLTESMFKRDEMKELMVAFKNKVVEDFGGEYSEGDVITCLTATLWDNSEIQISDFVTHKLDTNPLASSREPDGIVMMSKVTDYYMNSDKRSFGKLTITVSASGISAYKDVIKSINVYSSYPVSRLDLDKQVKIDLTSGEEYHFARFNIIELDDEKLEKQLLYKQKTIGIDELKNSSVSVVCKFNNQLLTNETLTVTSNAQRAGSIFTYNKRLHFFNTNAKVSFTNAMLESQFESGTSTTCTVYAFLRVDGMIKVAKHTGVSIKTTVITQADAINPRKMLTYPDSRCYRLVFVNSDNLVVDLNMESSKAYNYSYAYGKTVEFTTNSAVITELASYSTCTTTIEYGENTAINVTSQGNPIYFPVQNSYHVDQDIVDLGIAFEEISAVQTGQYPVYIFTKNGIYAMEQGSGDVLYGSIVPVNSDEVTGNVKQTRYGIVYVSNGKVMLLNGRQSKELSEFINGEPDMDIRGESGSSYRLCCCNSSLYNVTNHLSNYITATYDHLKEFLETAVINWSSSEDELIISNPSALYSYVFNFKYNAWHKISSSYIKSRINDIFLQRISGSVTKYIIDYSSKGTAATTFHIQTRPLMLSPNQYTVILRSILNIKSVVAATELVSVYLFGSDNCTDWHCIAGAQKKGCTLHDIRLNRCDKSYRYHVILIGGLTKPSTEILNVVMTIEDKLNSKIR